MRASSLTSLRRLADQVLEAADLDGLVRILTRSLPAALDIRGATLLLWDRRLETFEGVAPAGGETHMHPLRPGSDGLGAPETRYLLSDGQLLETPGKGEGTLVPLMARGGLAGMLVLGPKRRHGSLPLRPSEARLVSVIAARSALALENHIYQKELISSERMAALGTMASMLAHDFRGPMTVIRGYAETLLEPGLGPGEVQARASLIVEAVDRLERMTGETLDFARGGGRLARRTVSLPVFLMELSRGLSSELPGVEVVRAFDVPPDTTASLDVDKLRRVVSNIAANARDAMGGAGRIHISARTRAADGEGDELELVLADEGPGVAPEVRERLFQPFATFGKKKGTGLGLAVARRFVEDHGGTLDLLPEAEGGKGARFRIALPLRPRGREGQRV
ncbi:MAG TPA: ATP-binding protein [Vicinamibacteria bacterium]|jgi:signal transduction histidine kinase